MLWILLPAFNEEQSLASLLPKVDQALSAAGTAYRLVVVNDGSGDGTGRVLESFAERLPLTVITHPINRGLGETERDAFEYVAAHCGDDDIVVRLEGDDTHEPKYIFTLLDKLHEGYDVVNTSRFQPGGGQLGVSPWRAFVSRSANVFMGVVFGIAGVRDYSCGYRVYRAAVLRDAVAIYGNNFIQLRGLGFTSTLEIMVKLKLLGCRFTEVPFVLRYDQKQGGSKMIGSVTALGYMVMGVLYHWPFGGWRRQFKGLASVYRADRRDALSQYAASRRSRHAVSSISF